MESETLHLTLQTAVPLVTTAQPHDCSRNSSRKVPYLSVHKAAIINQTVQTVRKAAQQCLDAFKLHEEKLWWEPPIKEGKEKVKRISGHLRVVIKLREVAPLKGFQLPSAIKDGIHTKVADLLLSYAQRKLDPQFAEKTSWPTIDENFPIVWQMGFKFYEHQNTGKIYVYLSLFPRGGHREDLAGNADQKQGNELRVLGSDKLTRVKATGGLLLPLQFDKWGEASFMRDRSRPPVWKARHRKEDKRWIAELNHLKDFRPKRLELVPRSDGIRINIACDVLKKQAVEIKNFMGIAFGLHDLLTVTIIEGLSGNIIHRRNISAEEYECTYFRRLQKLRTQGGSFRQELDNFHYREVAKVIQEAVDNNAMIAVETVGNIPKGKYSPKMNLRLSYWPFGKLAEIISYKAEYHGLPKPYGVYSATMRLLCSECGANNKGDEKLVTLERMAVICKTCNTRHNSNQSTSLNLARKCRELYTAGVKAR